MEAQTTHAATGFSSRCQSSRMSSKFNHFYPAP